MSGRTTPKDGFEQGVDARAAGLTRADNPFGIGTPEHAEWLAGWMATFDLDEDSDPGSTRVQLVDNKPDRGTG